MIQLHNKNCFDVMAGIPTGSIDCIITDPPYFSTDLHFDKVERFCFETWLKECQRVLKPHGVLVSFADFNLLAEMRSEKVFKTNYELIWRKSMAVGFLDANVKPLMAHEFIGIFVDGLKKATYNPQKVFTGKTRKSYSDVPSAIYSNVKKTEYINNDGMYHPTTVVECIPDADKTDSSRMSKNRHPTQKPLDLVSWLIKTYSNEGDTIFDGFMGSGTTGHAATILNRNFIGCELHEPYFKLAEKRILDANHNIFNL